jgi:predicted nucleic acid-binding protein
VKGIADTGLLVALPIGQDRHHQWALDIARTASESLVTCESVLSEASSNVGSAHWVLRLVADGFVRIAFDLPRNFERIQELAVRYEDRKPDLADLCLIPMREIYETLPVITVDEKGFRVYRRNGRDVIPIICPPRG